MAEMWVVPAGGSWVWTASQADGYDVSDIIGPFPTEEAAIDYIRLVWDGVPEAEVADLPRQIFNPSQFLSVELGDEPGQFTPEGAAELAQDIVERDNDESSGISG